MLIPYLRDGWFIKDYNAINDKNNAQQNEWVIVILLLFILNWNTSISFIEGTAGLRNLTNLLKQSI